MIDENGKLVKSVFTSLTLNEISAVDRPAQPGATMSIMKRAQDEEDEDEDEDEDKEKNPFGKRALMLTPTNGHTHTLVDESGPGARTMVGETSYALDSDGMSHAHPWVRNPDTGSFTIGTSSNHIHVTLIDAGSLDQAISLEKVEAGVPDSAETSKSNSGVSADSVGTVPNEAIMAEKNDQTVDNEAVAKQLEEITKRAERAESVSELNDAQRGIFKSLDDEGQTSFLALSPDQRSAQVAKAAEANSVVYTSGTTGEEFRKSDDPRLVTLAKRADEERKLRIEGEEKAAKAELTKRASSFAHIPGGSDVVESILKGIDTLPVAEQGPALEALKAQDAGLGLAFVSQGTSQVPSTDNPLNAIAKAMQTQDPSLSPEQAMVKALETPEGEAAYAKSVGF